jgi:hypothetical protein
MEPGPGFYDPDGNHIDVGYRDENGIYFDDEGNRYIDVPESQRALDRYNEIRANDGDVDRISENTGYDSSVLNEIKQHLFFREHPYVPAPPDGRLRSGRFAAMDHIADLWRKAEAGTLDASEANHFRRLVAHEYVEARLMDEGVPYRSRDPQLWHDDYYTPTRDNNGAHDISPREGGPNAFNLWEKWGIPEPEPGFRVADDMSNLDRVVDNALDWWNERNPDGGYPDGTRPTGSAPGMAVDIDTDPGGSRSGGSGGEVRPEVYDTHPSTQINPDLDPDAPRTDTPDTDTANTSNTDSGWDGDRPKNGSGLTNEQRVQLAGSHLDDLDMSSREAFQNDFVERLNNSSELRGTFYRSDGHRWSASDTIGTERYEIPKVVWDSENGRWERTPEAEPPGYLGGPTDVRLNSPDADLPEGLREALSELDGLAEQRRLSIDAAGIAHERLKAMEAEHGAYNNKGPNHPALEEAKRNYRAAQDYTTKICEAFGEETAKVGARFEFNGDAILDNDGKPLERHDVDPETGETIRDENGKPKLVEFRPDLEGAELLPTADNAPWNGNNQFDQIYRTKDGDIVIVEAKSSTSTELGARNLPGAPPRRVSQGHLDYLKDILNEMKKRGESANLDEAALAREIEDKLRQGRVAYAVFKGDPLDVTIRDSEVDGYNPKEGNDLGWNGSTANGYTYEIFDVRGPRR